MITNETEIKANASIIDVVGHYIELKGNKACCPFHHEKTPSFNASEKRNIFKCFGCGVGGDSVAFIMKHKELSYPQALEELAKISGTPIERKHLSPEEKKKYKEQLEIKLQLKHYCNLVAEQYRPEQFSNTITFNKRPYSWSTIEAFQLGGAFEHNILSNHKVLENNILEKVGMIRWNDSTKLSYDTFRNRLVFPIHNRIGEIVGFAGRVTDDKKPKYLNTKESAVYKKRHTLYGLWQNRNQIRESGTAYLVEGYTDVITPYDKGIPQMVATCGTAFTQEQAQLLKKYADNVVICFDGDEAGIKATERAITIALEAGLSVEVLFLPEKEDPDSFISKHGNRAFLAYEETQKQNGVFWSVRKILGENPTTYEREKAIIRAGELIAVIQEETKRSILIDRLYKKDFLNCGKTTLKEAVKKYTINLTAEDRKKFTEDQKSDIYHYGIYIENNTYYAITAAGGSGYQISNFIIKPIFLLRKREGSKRLVEITNYHHESFVMDIDSDAMVDLGMFKKVVESQGNFLFFGNAETYMKVKKKVYREMKMAIPISILGLHRDGFYSWGNGISHSGKFYPTDEYGIVTYDMKNYFLPAFSKVTENDNEDGDSFITEKKFIMKTSKITFEEWSKLFTDVHGENGKIGILFYISCLYRDIIYDRFNFFPHLNSFGPPGSGKSFMAWSINAMFGKAQGPFMLDQGTNVGFFRRFAQIRNGINWMDEYHNNIHPKRIQALKASYDGAGHEKGTMSKDNKTITTPIRQGSMITGQELPTSDVALFKRVINLNFQKTTYTTNEEELANKLNVIEKKGELSSITVKLLSFRSIIEENFNQIFDRLMSEMKLELSGNDIVEDRIVKNTTILLGVYECLKDVIQFPFTMEEIKDRITKNIVRQCSMISSSSETNTFWEIIDFLHSQKQLLEDTDFKLSVKSELTVQVMGKSEKLPLMDQPLVLFLSLKGVYDLYNKAHRDRKNRPGLPKNSLDHYLKHSRGFIGKISSMRIGAYNTSCYAFRYEKLNINILKATEPDPEVCNKCNEDKDFCSCNPF